MAAAAQAEVATESLTEHIQRVHVFLLSFRHRRHSAARRLVDGA